MSDKEHKIDEVDPGVQPEGSPFHATIEQTNEALQSVLSETQSTHRKKMQESIARLEKRQAEAPHDPIKDQSLKGTFSARGGINQDKAPADIAAWGPIIRTPGDNLAKPVNLNMQHRPGFVRLQFSHPDMIFDVQQGFHFLAEFTDKLTKFLEAAHAQQLAQQDLRSKARGNH